MIFLTGGFSHVDTFDYKPLLNTYHGKSVPAFGLRPDETHDRPLLGSPFRFRPYGESGLMISDLFPKLGAMADELCVIRTLAHRHRRAFPGGPGHAHGLGDRPDAGYWLLDQPWTGHIQPQPTLLHGALRTPALRGHPGLG